jgi:hypothetical protein
LNAVKQELDEHETELKTQSTFAHLRDDVITEKITVNKNKDLIKSPYLINKIII